MFKPVSELHANLVSKKTEMFNNRDGSDRELIEKLIDEAYQRAEAVISVNGEWKLDENKIPVIRFEIDHFVSDALEEELKQGGWLVKHIDPKTIVTSK